MGLSPDVKQRERERERERDREREREENGERERERSERRTLEHASRAHTSSAEKNSVDCFDD